MTVARLQPAIILVDKVCVYGHKKVIMLLSAWPPCNGAAGQLCDLQQASHHCSGTGVLVSNPSAVQATAPPRAEAIRAQLLGRQRWGVVCRLITRPPAEAKRVQPMA